MKRINDEINLVGLKEKMCACKHLTLYSHLKCLVHTLCVCLCVRQNDKKMREDRHNSCIMIVTSEPFDLFMLLVCY